MSRYSQLVFSVKRDVVNYRGTFSFGLLIKLYLTNLGFRTVFLFRFMTAFGSKLILVKKLIRNHILMNYGCDFSIGCQIGDGLRIDHPIGVVIGTGVRIGKNCFLGQGVTLGEKFIDSRSSKAYPSIGDSVMIGAGAAVIGTVTIGDNVTIGARALVLSDVPESSTVVGIWK